MKRLTIQQAAKMRRVNPETVRRWVRNGIIPDRRPPGTRKIIVLDTDIFPPSTTELSAA